MFKFRPEVTQEHKDTFVCELKKLKELNSVKGHRLVVGGPSVTDPIERSQGFHYALLSFHENLAALQEYQASKEHHWLVVSRQYLVVDRSITLMRQVQGHQYLHVSLQGRFDSI